MKTHWKKLRNPDYLGAYSFDDGTDKILTIKAIAPETVTTADGSEQCTVARWAENEKPLILNVTNQKLMQKLFGTPYIEEWVGRQVTLFATKVKAFGEMTEAVRVRPFLPKPISTCADCKGEVKPAHGMTATRVAEYTTKTYGTKLCADCATKRKQAETAPTETEPTNTEEDTTK